MSRARTDDLPGTTKAVNPIFPLAGHVINTVVDTSLILAKIGSTANKSLYEKISPDPGDDTLAKRKVLNVNDTYAPFDDLFACLKEELVFRYRDAAVSSSKRRQRSGPNRASSVATPVFSNLRVLRIPTDAAVTDPRRQTEAGKAVEEYYAMEEEEKLMFVGVVNEVDSKGDSGEGVFTTHVHGLKTLRVIGTEAWYDGDLLEPHVPRPYQLANGHGSADSKSGQKVTGWLRRIPHDQRDVYYMPRWRVLALRFSAALKQEAGTAALDTPAYWLDNQMLKLVAKAGGNTAEEKWKANELFFNTPYARSFYHFIVGLAFTIAHYAGADLILAQELTPLAIRRLMNQIEVILNDLLAGTDPTLKFLKNYWSHGPQQLLMGVRGLTSLRDNKAVARVLSGNIPGREGDLFFQSYGGS
jgi:hypothetical protein